PTSGSLCAKGPTKSCGARSTTHAAYACCRARRLWMGDGQGWGEESEDTPALLTKPQGRIRTPRASRRAGYGVRHCLKRAAGFQHVATTAFERRLPGKRFERDVLRPDARLTAPGTASSLGS